MQAERRTLSKRGDAGASGFREYVFRAGFGPFVQAGLTCLKRKGANVMRFRIRDPIADHLARGLRREEAILLRSPELGTVRTTAGALGALALGAVAIGALAIGAVAIGRIAVGRARIRRLEIDDLVVRRLRVVEELQVPLRPDSENQA